MRSLFFSVAVAVLAAVSLTGCTQGQDDLRPLRAGFRQPPDSVRPGVYWYFMDGNLSAAGMRKDLISMKEAGIGRAVFLEVNVGVPQGPVDFLSPRWFELFRYMVHEADSLGIALTLGVGPGWAGSGGPWITAGQSMQQLVASSEEVSGPGQRVLHLDAAPPKRPYFGEGSLTPGLKKQWADYHRDVAVLAFPTPSAPDSMADVNEQALYYRAPFSSVAGVKPFLRDDPGDTAAAGAVMPSRVIDLTGKLSPDGTLRWQVPAGKWTVMRFVARSTGALTRPAPVQGLGFECSKFDTAAVNWQLENYVGSILKQIAPARSGGEGGLKMLHLDSWEMGSQNWSKDFRGEFIRRRGYDPLPFYPAYAGLVVGSRGLTERFLWDLRLTAAELVKERYAGQLRAYAHAHGLGFSVEPYDMNPAGDLELGSTADVPMGEFWSAGYGFQTAFSCIEAASLAHVEGRRVVQAESFTADQNEAWKQFPGSMKNQGDWAFAAGLNEFYYHTFAHKPFADSLVPGMTMGPYGVHWDRKQTWWPMVGAYHRYIARCQYLLQQGRTVADILYLTPEGAPQVFLAPPSALKGDSVMPDRRGFNFDGCAPGALMQASVKDHRLVFPGGASYRLLVLPRVSAMTPALLTRIDSLVREGAAVVGTPPSYAPGLGGYPASDSEVRRLARDLWGDRPLSPGSARQLGAGTVIAGPGPAGGDTLYPRYDLAARTLHGFGLSEDFATTLPLRYTHRTSPAWDIYFVSNRTDSAVRGEAVFRTGAGSPECWDPVTGGMRKLPAYGTTDDGHTTVTLAFAPYQSYFVVFPHRGRTGSFEGDNFPRPRQLDTLNGAWTVHFDPKMGAPGTVRFDSLEDWTRDPREGIRFYSGIARYVTTFDAPRASEGKGRFYIDLGTVHDLARVILNGKDLGVAWTPPFRVEATGALRARGNTLEVRVANRWPNRLIGDARYPSDGIQNGQWPAWLVQGGKRPGKRYTFTSFDPYQTGTPLLPSGLLGPVTVVGDAP